MSGRKHHLKELQVICKCKNKKRKALAQSASNRVIRTIAQVGKNVLNGNFKLSPRQKQRIRRHKKILRALSLKRSSLKSKRKLLIQKGGAFLPLLLGPILSAVAGSLFNQ